MQTLLYTRQSVAGSWRIPAMFPGVVLLTSPPMTAEEVGPETLEGHDLLVFSLHGLAGEPYWYGDDYVAALDAETVRRANLSGAMAFASTCYGLTDDEEPDAMARALLDAGAVVIAGGGPNYVAREVARGADLLARWFLLARLAGLAPGAALRAAKARLRIGAGAAEKDALAFRLLDETGRGYDV